MRIVRRLRMPVTEKLLSAELRDMMASDDNDEFETGTLELVEELRGAEKKSQGRDLDMLSHTELAKLHLARALIMNPEVLVFHRPVAAYDDLDTRRLVFTLIKEHRDNRGLEMPPESSGRRRMRTVFFSSDLVVRSGEDVADVIWRIVPSLDGGSGPPFTIRTIQASPK
jgi:ABC-type taurine transport system ATPase subunit